MKYINYSLYIFFVFVALPLLGSESSENEAQRRRRIHKQSLDESKKVVEDCKNDNNSLNGTKVAKEYLYNEKNKISKCIKCLKKYPHLKNISQQDIKSLLMTTNLFKQSIEKLSKEGGSVADVHQFFKFVSKSFSVEDVADMINQADGDEDHFIRLVYESMADLQECTSIIKNR